MKRAFNLLALLLLLLILWVLSSNLSQETSDAYRVFRFSSFLRQTYLLSHARIVSNPSVLQNVAWIVNYFLAANYKHETWDQEPILNCIEKRSIKWYGHVVRMQDYRKPKQTMEARREKRRGRGRPRRTGEDCVIDVARRKGKTLVELKRLARDRIAFRK